MRHVLFRKMIYRHEFLKFYEEILRQITKAGVPSELLTHFLHQYLVNEMKVHYGHRFSVTPSPARLFDEVSFVIKKNRKKDCVFFLKSHPIDMKPF
jgi:hypothetical protein